MSREITDREYDVIHAALIRLANYNLGIGLRAVKDSSTQIEFLELYHEANNLQKELFGKKLMIIE